MLTAAAEQAFFNKPAYDSDDSSNKENSAKDKPVVVVYSTKVNSRQSV